MLVYEPVSSRNLPISLYYAEIWNSSSFCCCPKAYWKYYRIAKKLLYLIFKIQWVPCLNFKTIVGSMSCSLESLPMSICFRIPSLSWALKRSTISMLSIQEHNYLYLSPFYSSWIWWKCSPRIFMSQYHQMCKKSVTMLWSFLLL